MRRLDAFGKTIYGPTLNSLYGTHAARPVATEVSSGTIYFESDTGQVFRSDGSAWVGPINSGALLAYVERTTSYTISPDTPTSMIALPSYTFDGTPVSVEFFAPGITQYSYGGSGTEESLWLYMDGVDQGKIHWGRSNSGNGDGRSVCVKRKIAPAAGSHVLAIYAGGSSAGSCHVDAGNGGAGNLMPMHLQITKA